jgi:hypothetical protein
MYIISVIGLLANQLPEYFYMINTYEIFIIMYQIIIIYSLYCVYRKDVEGFKLGISNNSVKELKILCSKVAYNYKNVQENEKNLELGIYGIEPITITMSVKVKQNRLKFVNFREISFRTNKRSMSYLRKVGEDVKVKQIKRSNKIMEYIKLKVNNLVNMINSKKIYIMPFLSITLFYMFFFLGLVYGLVFPQNVYGWLNNITMWDWDFLIGTTTEIKYTPKYVPFESSWFWEESEGKRFLRRPELIHGRLKMPIPGVDILGNEKFSKYFEKPEELLKYFNRPVNSPGVGYKFEPEISKYYTGSYIRPDMNRILVIHKMLNEAIESIATEYNHHLVHVYTRFYHNLDVYVKLKPRLDTLRKEISTLILIRNMDAFPAVYAYAFEIFNSSYHFDFTADNVYAQHLHVYKCYDDLRKLNLNIYYQISEHKINSYSLQNEVKDTYGNYLRDFTKLKHEISILENTNKTLLDIGKLVELRTQLEITELYLHVFNLFNTYFSQNIRFDTVSGVQYNIYARGISKKYDYDIVLKIINNFFVHNTKVYDIKI